MTHQALNKDGFDYLLFPAEGKANGLIVVFHGNGSDAINMQRWINAMRHENKGADIISVEGPVEMDVSLKLRQKHNIPADRVLRTWFGMQSVWSLLKHVSAHVFNRVALFKNLNRFIDARLAERGLGDDRLVVAGLSLGGIVAAHTALARPVACAGLVSASSSVLPGLRVRARPDTFVMIGTEDHIFYGGKTPKKFLSRQFARAAAGIGLTHAGTVKRLTKRRIPLQAHIYEDMPHIPTDAAYADSARFIAARIGK
jgi:predicted esterase